MCFLIHAEPVPMAEAGVDFVALSMYKILGFPTSIGCLLVRSTARERCFGGGYSYFGGGSIDACALRSRFRALKPALACQLERGTPDYGGLAMMGSINIVARAFVFRTRSPHHVTDLCIILEWSLLGNTKF